MQINSEEIKLLLLELEINLKRVSAKDISKWQGISLSQAQRIYKDIKVHFEIDFPPTVYHLKEYLKIA